MRQPVRREPGSRARRHASRVLALLVAVLAIVAVPAPAGATTPCGKKLVKDWSDNSRIDGVYDLHCYEDAIAAIPSDIRDYTNAVEVISRAFQDATGRRLAIRKSEAPSANEEPPDVPPVVGASSPSAVPVPLLVLGAMSLALLGAGALGYVSRRRSALTSDHSDDEDPLG